MRWRDNDLLVDEVGLAKIIEVGMIPKEIDSQITTIVLCVNLIKIL